MKKKSLFIYILVLILCLSVLIGFASCNGNNRKFINLVDSAGRYKEVRLSADQMAPYNDARITNCYESKDQRVFVVTSDKGYCDKITMVILMRDSIVVKITVAEQAETPSKGGYCFKPKFLSQFEGLDLSKYPEIKGVQDNRSKKDGDVIFRVDATITSQAIIDCVNAVSHYLAEI